MSTPPFFSESDVRKLPYYPALAHIRKTLEENLSDFPHNRCCCATYIISETIFRLIPLGGEFTYDGIVSSHAWNYDPVMNVFVDITFDQFVSRAPPIVVLPVDNPILSLTLIDHWEYIQSDYTHLSTLVQELTAIVQSQHLSGLNFCSRNQARH